MRRLLKLLLVFALVAILGLALALAFVDRAARAAIERGGSHALGVPTHLESADVGLTSGRLTLSELSIENPKGFEAPRFLDLRRGEIALSLGSLTSEVIEAPSLVLDGLALSLERKDGKANYDSILESLARLGSPGRDAPPDGRPAEPGKRFVIREIVLNDVSAQVRLVALGGELTDTTIKLPVIRLKNVGNDPRSLGELIGAILDGVLRALIDSGGANLPKELLQDLSRKLPDLDAAAKAFEREIDRSLGELGKDLGDKTQKALEDAKKQLDGLFEKR